MRGARYVCLIPWTLQSGSKQFIYNWKLKNNLDLDQGNWRKLNGMYERKTGTKEKEKSRTEAVRKQKSC
jgi:hypothetical protein